MESRWLVTLTAILMLGTKQRVLPKRFRRGRALGNRVDDGPGRAAIAAAEP